MIYSYYDLSGDVSNSGEPPLWIIWKKLDFQFN